ncbi:hypothetical protein N0V94_002725 [Neodidymelliopsis sp. IMI 364377]|nr:hypothetical protein N0V94_002725 [Neodidymelliopsis sp. IMI 364377]
MTKLFDELCERFTKANKAWERFDGPCGDVLYFTNDLGCAAENILHRIRESFEKLADLELTLTRLQRTCERSREDLALLFTYESHGMNRRMTGLSSHVVELTESASKLAEKGQQVAEDTSRATRVNVQMLMVTTAIIIALQYFCSERALFGFDRNDDAAQRDNRPMVAFLNAKAA